MLRSIVLSIVSGREIGAGKRMHTVGDGDGPVFMEWLAPDSEVQAFHDNPVEDYVGADYLHCYLLFEPESEFVVH